MDEGVEVVEARSFADDLVDGVLPEDFDWEKTVRRYPVAALSIAALGGFLLGRTRGEAVFAALSGFAAATVSERVNSLLGSDVI